MRFVTDIRSLIAEVANPTHTPCHSVLVTVSLIMIQPIDMYAVSSNRHRFTRNGTFYNVVKRDSANPKSMLKDRVPVARIGTARSPVTGMPAKKEGIGLVSYELTGMSAFNCKFLSSLVAIKFASPLTVLSS